jgi:3-oxoacyl-[acyl-carrier protein] reductase
VQHELAGKTAVVTGTAHGIGAAIAEALRDDGARVRGVDKDTADLSVSADVAAFFAGDGHHGHPPALGEVVGGRA